MLLRACQALFLPSWSLTACAGIGAVWKAVGGLSHALKGVSMGPVALSCRIRVVALVGHYPANKLMRRTPRR